MTEQSKARRGAGHPHLKRRCHWLWKNRQSARPSKILLWDTEARIDTPDPWTQEHSFRLGVGCLCEYTPEGGLTELEWRDFVDPQKFWDWVGEIAAEAEGLLAVAHNIDYDARVARAFSLLPEAGWSPSYFIPAKGCRLYEWKRGKARLRMLDSCNFFRGSLADLGESVGLEKLEVDFETVADPELLTYCRRDVAILVAAFRELLAFLDKHDLGDFAVSAASQSFRAYRHRFLPCKIGIHNRADIVQLSRAAYRGGRCEAFYVGKLPEDTYTLLDVVSLYPSMMRSFPLPRRAIKTVRDVCLEYLDHLLSEYLCIAECVVDTLDPIYPLKVGGHNVYPVGSFFTVLTHGELERARIEGHLRGVGRVVLYEPAVLFGEYIDEMIALKQQYRAEGRHAWAQLAKDLANHLPGKFGQHGYKQTILGDAPIDEVKMVRWVQETSGATCVDFTFGGKVIRQERSGEAFDSFPAIPAHVNAYGRLHMWSLIQQAGRGNVFYIDTDGIIVNREGAARLASEVRPTELGYLKVEAQSEHVEIQARKHYTLGSRVVRKGIRREAEQVSEGVYHQWHFTSALWGLEQGTLDGVTVKRAKKTLRRNLTAGTVQGDGWVLPPRVRVTRGEIAHRSSRYTREHRWEWCFDDAWLRQIAEEEATRDRLERTPDHLRRAAPEFSRETPPPWLGGAEQGQEVD